MKKSFVFLCVLCAFAVILALGLSPEIHNIAAIAAAYNFYASTDINAGDVVVWDPSVGYAVKTATSEGSRNVAGVAAETVPAGADCTVRQDGGRVTVNVIGSVARGQWLITSTTAGKAKGVGSAEPGIFAVAITDSGIPGSGQCYATVNIGWLGLGSEVGAATDHGTLTGLGDDDHSQYHTDSRGDVRYLYRENTSPFTPDADYEPATKKYVDDNAASGGAPLNATYLTRSSDPNLTSEVVTSDDIFYASNYADLQSAINAAGSNGGGIVIASLGSHPEAVTISHNNITLMGHGPGTIIDGGTTGHAISVADADDVTIMNLAVQTTAGGGNAYSGISVDGNSDRVRIQNVTVNDSDAWGILVSGSYAIISNCLVKDCDSVAIGLGSAGTRSTISNCLILSCDDTCIYTGTGTYYNIIGNIIYSANAVFSIQCLHDYGVITGNTCYAQDVSSVSIGLAADSSYLAVVGNYDRGSVANVGSNNVIAHNS